MSTLQLKNSPNIGNSESETNSSIRNENQDSDNATNASMSSQSSPIARFDSIRDPFLVNFQAHTKQINLQLLLRLVLYNFFKF